MDLEAAAAIAADPDASARARVDALISVVEAVTIKGVAIPDVIAAAVDDVALVDAALAMNKASAVCAALHQLGVRPELATTRRRVVRRLVAGGAAGLGLAGLAFEIGDLPSGVRLAIADYETHIAVRLSSPPDSLVAAWIGWLCDQSDVAATAILSQLDVRRSSLEDLLAHTTNRVRIERLRRLARSILSS